MVKRTKRLLRAIFSAIVLASMLWLALLQLTWVWLSTSPESVTRWVRVVTQERLTVDRFTLSGDWTHPRITLRGVSWRTPSLDAHVEEAELDVDWLGYMRHPGLWGERLRITRFHVRRSVLRHGHLNIDPQQAQRALSRLLRTLALPFVRIYLIQGRYQQGGWTLKVPGVAISRQGGFHMDGLVKTFYADRLLWTHVIHGTLTVDWRGYWKTGALRLTDIHPARLKDLAPIFQADWRHGQLALNAELEVSGGRPVARLHVDLGELENERAEDARQVRSVGASLVWRESGAGDRFSIERWRFNGALLPNVAPAWVQLTENRLQLNVARFRLADFGAALQDLLPDWPVEQVAFDLEGLDARFQLKPFALTALRGRITRLRWPESVRYPGMEARHVELGLDGRAIVTTLAEPVRLHWKQWRPATKRITFRQPLHWRVDDRGVRLRAVTFLLDGKVSGRADFSLVEGHLRASAELRPQRMERVKEYLPYGLMSKKLAHWLQNGLVAGEVAPVTLRIDGPLEAFPFSHGEGVFTARTHVRQATLRFSHRWPVLTGLDAKVSFQPWRIAIDATQAGLDGVRVRQARVEIGPLRKKKPVALTLVGQAEGTAQTVQRLLLDSVLAERLGLGKVLGGPVMLAEGTVTAQVALWLPLHGYDGRVPQVDVQATLHDVGLRLAQKHQLKGVSGAVHITHRSAVSGRLKGRLDGQPVSAQVATDVARNALQLKVDGRWPMQRLLADVEGSWHWRARAFIPLRRNATVRIQGGLTPEHIRHNRVPAPLGQWLSEPVTLQGTFSRRQVFLQLAQAGQRFAGVTLRPFGHQFRLHNLTVLLNTSEGARRILLRRGTPGILVQANIHQPLELEKLRDWWRHQRALFGTSGGALPTVVVGARLDEVRWGIQRFRQVYLNAYRVDRRRMGAELRSGKARVLALYLPEQDQLALNVERLQWRTAETEPTQACRIHPARPDRLNLFFIGQHIRFGAYDFDEVRFNLHADPAQLRLENLRMAAAEGRLSGKGQLLWSWRNNETMLQFDLQARPVEAMLQWAGFSESGFTGRKGALKARLHWHGTPDCFTLRGVQGTAQVRFDDGVIRKAKVGMARLISLLSVDSLLRSIDTTVNQLRYEGMAYEVIEAEASLMKGMAKLKRFRMEAPLVHAALKGRVDYARRQYDLLATVSPKIGGTVTTLAALLGVANPIAALTTYLLMKNLPGIKEGLIRYHYKVIGPWDKPVITPLDGDGQGTGRAQTPAETLGH